MKRCSLMCAGIWPFILLPLLLMVPLLFFKWHAIEKDVASNTEADLASIGANWAKVETNNRGRDVLITGTPPNQAAIDLVKEKAEKSYGVHTVDISSDVKPPVIIPDKPELNTIITGESVVLRGTLASQASIDKIITQAETAFGSGNIINKLRIGENTAALPNLDGFFLALTNKAYALETLTSSLIGNKLSLSGTVNSRESKTSLADQMAGSLRLAVTDNLTVAVPPVDVAPLVEVPPAPAETVSPVDINICQNQLNDLLKAEKINFASGKSIIQENSFALLETIKALAEKCTDARFEVSGHTDSVGNPSFNTTLSEKRAKAVVDHLTALGLDASRFESIGYGASRPIADNNSATGRAQNRRIEFTLKK